MIKHVWEGVYNSFDEVPVRQDGHESEMWLQRSIERTKKLLEEEKNSRTTPQTSINRDSLLPFLTSLVSIENNPVNILDFGGGIGVTYIPVRQSLPKDKSLSYYIVEIEQIVREGKKIFHDDSSVYFDTELPDKNKKIDIVHFGSSLQYVDDWKGLLGKSVVYSPKYYLFTDLYAGENRTFVTAQHYYGSTMACRFFNIHEFIQVMRDIGYSLQFISTYRATILGKEQESPLENFPPEYRLGHACNILFIQT